jgi:hydrogenase large subunit
MVLDTPNGFSLDNTGQRIVVDPVTRIEGHMRCEVNVDENNVIRNAVSTGHHVAGPRGYSQGPRPA